MTTNQSKSHSQSSNKKSSISDAARTMRTSNDPEERSRAAAEMGRKGGEHSHGGGRPTKNENDNQIRSQNRKQSAS